MVEGDVAQDAFPVEVRAPRGARVLEVEWDDGAISRLHHRVLRGFCPCAHCQGHHGPIEWVEGTEALPEQSLELEGVSEVGQYALQLEWGDGHATGIYSFRYLRDLGAVGESDQEHLREARFGR